MTTRGTQRWMAAGLAALIFGLLTTIPASAEISQKDVAGHPEVAEQLTLLRETAAGLQNHADALSSFTRMRLHWTTHADRLETLKQHVNKMGKTLTSLEALKPHANDEQRMAIENVRPHLEGVAYELTEAINLVAEDRNSVHWPPYSESVKDIHTQAKSLYQTVDVILDYQQSRMRLENLDLPTSTEGS